MADSSAPASAPDAGQNYDGPMTLREAADALPDDAFAGMFDDDEGPAEAPAQAPAPQPRRAPEPQPRAETRPRRPDGKFAATTQEAPAEDADADQGDDPAPEADQPAEQTDPNAPQEQPSGDQPSEDEGDKKAKADKPAMHIEIDGQRYSAEDIRRGFLRNEDYTRKTQEVSAARQQLQQHAQRLQSEEQQLAQVLDIAVKALRETLPPAPPAEMIDQDVVAYNKQMAAHSAAVERLRNIAGLHEQTAQQTAQQRQQLEMQQQAAMQQTLQREFAQMQEKLPELRTREGQEQFFSEARKYGEHYGLSPQEVAGIQDHRALLVLKDAIAWRKLQTQKPQTVKRLEAAPPIRPQPRAAAGTRQGQARREAIQRFQENPSIKNALDTGVLDGIF